MNRLVFDIETVPDVELGRRTLNLEDLSDAQVAKAMYTLQRQRSGGEFRSRSLRDLRFPWVCRLWLIGSHERDFSRSKAPESSARHPNRAIMRRRL